MTREEFVEIAMLNLMASGRGNYDSGMDIHDAMTRKSGMIVLSQAIANAEKIYANIHAGTGGD